MSKTEAGFWYIATPVQHAPPDYAEAEVSPEILALEKWRSLLLIGPPGTGKTWQLWALVNHYVDDRPGAHIDAGRQAVHVISACTDIDAHRYDQEWLTAWCEFSGVLCIDDVGYRQPDAWAVQAVYAIANERRAHQRRTIWTTNMDRDALAMAFGAPVASRLMGGLVIDTGGPDRRLSPAEREASA